MLLLHVDFFKQSENLASLYVALFLRFSEHRDSVAQNLESSAARRHEIDCRVRVFLRELSRQTGGSGIVVSDRAVLDLDLHNCSG